jgi:hypothetical protein|nr:MAG TPA: hypothetical protein [Caudoviricetes sp.]
MKLAKVFFENSLKSWSKAEALKQGKKLYCFLVNEADNASEGDTWAAWTQNGLQIVKVVEVVKYDELDEEHAKATQYLVDHIAIAIERDRQHARLRKDLLEQKLKERAAKVIEMEKYRELAKNDKTLANVVKEYDELETKLGK